MKSIGGGLSPYPMGSDCQLTNEQRLTCALSFLLGHVMVRTPLRVQSLWWSLSQTKAKGFFHGFNVVFSLGTNGLMLLWILPVSLHYLWDYTASFGVKNQHGGFHQTKEAICLLGVRISATPRRLISFKRKWIQIVSSISHSILQLGRSK